MMAEQNIVSFFTVMILSQFFISLAVTSIAYALPDNAKNYAETMNNETSRLSIEDVANDLEGGIQKQTNIPIIDVAALVYYSGNMVLDFLMNWAFGLAVLINLILGSIMMLFGVNVGLMLIVKISLTALMGAFYFIGILRLIMGIRSGNLV